MIDDSSFDIQIVTEPDDLEACLALRYDVFVTEQDVPLDEEGLMAMIPIAPMSWCATQERPSGLRDLNTPMVRAKYSGSACRTLPADAASARTSFSS